MSQCDLDWLALGREVLEIEEEAVRAVRERLDDEFVRAVTLLAGCAGRVVVTGIGKSGLVGRKIAATLSSTGTPSFFLHPVEGAHGDLGMIRPGDVALAISNSGETDELNAILPTLKSLGARVVALTGRRDSTLARLADAVIDVAVPREACPMNLAPTSSTTAALAVGDALAVCLIRWKEFGERDFQRFHPGGALGARLRKKVECLMRTENLPVTRETAKLKDALQVMNDGRLGVVVAVDGAGRLAGIFTDGDLRRLVVRGECDVERPLAAYVVKTPRVARPEESAAQALDVMEEKAITALPVVDEEGRVVGVVHMHDLLGQGGVKFAG